jgi:hypothetical protein
VYTGQVIEALRRHVFARTALNPAIAKAAQTLLRMPSSRRQRRSARECLGVGSRLRLLVDIVRKTKKGMIARAGDEVFVRRQPKFNGERRAE